MAKYDPVAINAAVNLVDLVGADTSLRRVSGEEHAGPCPKCGAPCLGAHRYWRGATESKAHSLVVQF